MNWENIIFLIEIHVNLLATNEFHVQIRWCLCACALLLLLWPVVHGHLMGAPKMRFVHNSTTGAGTSNVVRPSV